MFGQFGVSDGNPNATKWSAFAGVGGTSFIPGREQDRWGVAYFRYSPSKVLRDGLDTLGFALHDEHGVEAFYNVALTPWLLLTPDLQVVNPAAGGASTAVVGSLRLQVKL
ncbi:Carbohydrate-selective porin, OprB family [compost metagenome]